MARNEVGDSARSAASNAVTPAGLPGAPRITSAEPGLSQVRVDWTAADPNGDAVVNYQLRVDGGGWEDVGNRTSYTRGGLANSTQYTFEVRAVNSVGVGPASNAATARTPGEPGQPNTPALDAGNRLIDVYWVARRRTTARRSPASRWRSTPGAFARSGPARNRPPTRA